VIKHGFIEGGEFFRISGKSTGGRLSQEYFITEDFSTILLKNLLASSKGVTSDLAPF
jgi:hypothetical protein